MEKSPFTEDTNMKLEQKGEEATRELLIVEDNPADSYLMVQALKRLHLHYHVNIVTDGDAALDFLHQQDAYATAPRPALVLLDLNLPRRNGSEVLAAMKVDPELQQIPVVMMSTSSNREDLKQAYALGAARFFVKPMSWEGFLQMMNDALRVGDAPSSSVTQKRLV